MWGLTSLKSVDKQSWNAGAGAEAAPWRKNFFSQDNLSFALQALQLIEWGPPTLSRTVFSTWGQLSVEFYPIYLLFCSDTQSSALLEYLGTKLTHKTHHYTNQSGLWKFFLCTNTKLPESEIKKNNLFCNSTKNNRIHRYKFNHGVKKICWPFGTVVQKLV